VNAEIPEDHKFQTAAFFRRRYGLSDQRIKTAALMGKIRHRVLDRKWHPCVYHVDDVAAFVEQLAKTPVFLPKGMRRAELAAAASSSGGD
jgi:hypothetical protein